MNVCSKAGQRRQHVAARAALALAMTRRNDEAKSPVMAEPSVLPHRTEFQRMTIARLANDAATLGDEAD
jgi:hypothetical protein